MNKILWLCLTAVLLSGCGSGIGGMAFPPLSSQEKKDNGKLDDLGEGLEANLGSEFVPALANKTMDGVNNRGEEGLDNPLQEAPRKLRLLQQDEVFYLSDMELTLLVGAPSFIWRDGPAEVWRYRQGECVTDFYLYAGERGASIHWMEQLNLTLQRPLSSPCLLVFETEIKNNP